jgi:autotransporter-associated beta strand protein
MQRNTVRTLLLAAIALPTLACGQPAVAPDPGGILRKPIPDRLVVLTFDDACASGYTVVAPILKPLGFNASFYVCDFDSFKTRKDWYLTWRQMKELDGQGFEIGNHTVGHGGSLSAFQAMEDELFANGGPRMTTVCWPLYGVAWNICPDLSKSGYTFGRGGHERPYRPTVDNPFDVPSFTITDNQPIEAFVNKARQACQGRVVVYCFHGVPDMEHGAVGVAPETFKVMMQYLKDNNYKVIAMRDLAEYVDTAKAAKLPPPKEVKAEEPFLTNKDDKPCGVVVKAAKSNLVPEKETLVRKSNDKLITNASAVKAIRSDRPNVFTWKKAEAGNWSDGTKWSNNLTNGSAPVAAGQPDYVLNFDQAGKYRVTDDMDEGFLLNQLNLSVGNGNSLTLTGKGLKFGGPKPSINQSSGFTHDSITGPITLASDTEVNLIAGGGRVALDGLISGAGCLVVNGGNGNESGDLNGGPNQHYSTLSLNGKSNTYSGGTIINGGTLRIEANSALGTGPVTLNEGAGFVPGQGNATNPLILNGGTIDAGGINWNAPITLNGNTRIAGRSVNFNNIGGGMSGPGGFTVIGTWIAFGRGNDSELNLCGTNTYTGQTIVHQGALYVKKAAALYNADPTQWTPARISVHPAATLVISAGGPGEFSGEQIGTLLKNLTAAVDGNGLLDRSTFCLDTANAKAPVTVAANIPDSKGPGGGAFLIRKRGAGTLQLSGKNTYTGQTILESGALSVSSFNSFTKGKNTASSSLGSPTDIEGGEIVIGEEGKEGEGALIYTGTGETSDRVMNLAGKKSTVTFEQSGTGLLKLTSTFVISGYGADKTIVLMGDTAGTGEIAGSIVNPYDRAGKATTAITKSGSGTWTLSGANTYSGKTTVQQGTLSLASAKSLGDNTDVYVSEGAMLEMSFKGEKKIGKLYLDGKEQPAGAYSAENAPKYLKGKGLLKNSL